MDVGAENAAVTLAMTPIQPSVAEAVDAAV